MRRDQELRELLRMLGRKLSLLDKDEASCCGTSLSQCHTLVELARNRQLSVVELADILGLDKSTASRTVDSLVQKGLVTREAAAEDRRYLRMELTESGQQVVKAINHEMEDYYARVYLGIPEEKRAQVLESLVILLKALDSTRCCE